MTDYKIELVCYYCGHRSENGLEFTTDEEGNIMCLLCDASGADLINEEEE